VASPIDAYKTLQVDPEAEDEVIQAAYRRLAQKYHPDRQTNDEGVERMVAINAAWELLRDPARRAAYDAARAKATRPEAAARAPGAPTRSAPPQRPAGPSAATGVPPAGQAQPRPASGSANRPPETVSRDWTSGRSGAGGGYDASTMRKAEGHGAAGPPPGNPSGTVLMFGRYMGWSIGEIARTDLEYLEWLDRMSIGRAYRDEIDLVLRKAGRRRSSTADAADRHGLFRRR
jgi:curved DNA-binding protein CbpA